MRKTFVRIFVATLLLVACGSTPVLAGGGEPLPPFCPPGYSCVDINPVLAGGSEPLPPFCPPGYACVDINPVLADGSNPTPPFCPPGYSCD